MAEKAGIESLVRMKAVLHACPPAVNLAEWVVTNFGKTLIFLESVSAKDSSFTVNTDKSKKQVEIVLKTGTGREAPALSHELLHASLLIDGFPWILSYRTPLVNYLYHEVMFEPFLALGFAAQDFVGVPKIHDYEAPAQKGTMSFDQWCGEYYCHWITWRHTRYAESKRCMDQIEQLAARQYSGFSDAVKEIHAWYKRGQFRQPDQFIAAYDNLLGIMKCRDRNRWCRVDVVSGVLEIHPLT